MSLAVCPHGVEPAITGQDARLNCWVCMTEIRDRMKAKIDAPASKAARIAFLERKRAITIEDLKIKCEAEDWHGCQDCGSDLRDIDNEIFGLKY